ncbi:MAG: 6,7-dimethyl-8-ribityllumazine synthase [Persephonella sp.]|nr:6,7-dimethyl-8-ribityllumazine synthase [Persephonella sp.]
MRQIEGQLNAEGFRFAIVVGRFNSLITEKLLEGAVDCILRRGGSEERTLQLSEFPALLRYL